MCRPRAMRWRHSPPGDGKGATARVQPGCNFVQGMGLEFLLSLGAMPLRTRRP